MLCAFGHLYFTLFSSLKSFGRSAFCMVLLVCTLDACLWASCSSTSLLYKKINCFKTSAATTHLDNEECTFHTHRRHFSFLSYTCKRIFYINKQKERKRMIENPCILTRHTREHILHSWTPEPPEPPLNHYSHEDVPPHGMTHILINGVTRIRHTPLREYHHPTVTQHKHHHQQLISW